MEVDQRLPKLSMSMCMAMAARHSCWLTDSGWIKMFGITWFPTLLVSSKWLFLTWFFLQMWSLSYMMRGSTQVLMDMPKICYVFLTISMLRELFTLVIPCPLWLDVLLQPIGLNSFTILYCWMPLQGNSPLTLSLLFWLSLRRMKQYKTKQKTKSTERTPIYKRKVFRILKIILRERLKFCF